MDQYTVQRKSLHWALNKAIFFRGKEGIGFTPIDDGCRAAWPTTCKDSEERSYSYNRYAYLTLFFIRFRFPLDPIRSRRQRRVVGGIKHNTKAQKRAERLEDLRSVGCQDEVRYALTVADSPTVVGII